MKLKFVKGDKNMKWNPYKKHGVLSDIGLEPGKVPVNIPESTELTALVEIINNWQGIDQPISEDFLSALIWTMSVDSETHEEFNQLVINMREDLRREMEKDEEE